MVDPTASRSRNRWLASATATLVALAIAYPMYRVLGPAAHAPQIYIDPGPEDAEPWRDHNDFVVDPVVGHRPRRGMTVEFSMSSLDFSETETIVRRNNNLSFVREDDLEGEVTQPVVIVLGDSHVHGIVSTKDNVGPLLEMKLRASAGLEQATVLNAGCGFYSLYHYVLRARSLVDAYAPRAIAVVVFMGNDLLDLENQRFPHLDDNLAECPVADNPPKKGTTLRMKALALPLEGAFWQGMNQAMYLNEHPDRAAVIRRKMRRAVELMKALAKQRDIELLYILLPSSDVVFPDKMASLNPVTKAVIESGAQTALYADFRSMLDDLGVRFVDLLPRFIANGKLDLYATDFHIWKPGHAMVASAIAEALTDRLYR